MIKKTSALMVTMAMLSTGLQAQVYEYTVPLEERDISEMPYSEMQQLTPFGTIVNGVLYKKGVKERQDALKQERQKHLDQAYFLEKSKIQFEGIAARVLMNALKNSNHPSIEALARKTLVDALQKMLKTAPTQEVAKVLKLYGDQVMNQALLSLHNQVLSLKPQMLEQELKMAVNRATSAVVLHPDSVEGVKTNLQKEAAEIQAKGLNPAAVNAYVTHAMRMMDETYLTQLVSKDPKSAIQHIQSGKYNDYGAPFLKTWLERAQHGLDQSKNAPKS